MGDLVDGGARRVAGALLFVCAWDRVCALASEAGTVEPVHAGLVAIGTSALAALALRSGPVSLVVPVPPLAGLEGS